MAERLTSHLDGMKTAAANAVAFLDGMPLDLFVADPKTQSAVAMCLALVGEAANRIAADSPEFIAAHPQWPWDQMRGLRNRIVHSYDTLDLPVVWSTVTDFLPSLLSAISKAESPNGG